MFRRLVPFLGCVLALSAVHAQSVHGCPLLPGDSGLSWDQRGTGDFLICSAVDPEGNEAFGVSLSADSAFQPRRANRGEHGVVARRDVRWYRAEVGAQPDVLVRETLVELAPERVAHIWIRARSQNELQRTMSMVERLEFNTDN